jgi:hypothetical protein
VTGKPFKVATIVEAIRASLNGGRSARKGGRA